MNLKNFPCNLCGSTEYKIIFPNTQKTSFPTSDKFCCTSNAYGVHLQIVKCHHCGLIYANPRWDELQIIDYYAKVTDSLFLEKQEDRRLTFQSNIRELEKIAGDYQNQRLLDIGCYTGVFLEVAQKRGWRVRGVELSLWALDQAQKKGLPVFAGSLRKNNFPANSFEVVTMWDVIEHLPDPSGEISEISKILTPGGILAIHTIDIGSLWARFLGARWPWLMEMHLNYFSRETLRKLVIKNGFQIIKVKTQGRYVQLGYLASRLAPYNAKFALFFEKFLEKLNWRNKFIRINLGDIFTLYAQKKIKN